jgi:hypothetical protein
MKLNTLLHRISAVTSPLHPTGSCCGAPFREDGILPLYSVAVKMVSLEKFVYQHLDLEVGNYSMELLCGFGINNLLRKLLCGFGRRNLLHVVVMRIRKTESAPVSCYADSEEGIFTRY